METTTTPTPPPHMPTKHTPSVPSCGWHRPPPHSTATATTLPDVHEGPSSLLDKTKKSLPQGGSTTPTPCPACLLPQIGLFNAKAEKEAALIKAIRLNSYEGLGSLLKETRDVVVQLETPPEGAPKEVLETAWVWRRDAVQCLERLMKEALWSAHKRSGGGGGNGAAAGGAAAGP